jgi:hypothetical protein
MLLARKATWSGKIMHPVGYGLLLLVMGCGGAEVPEATADRPSGLPPALSQLTHRAIALHRIPDLRANTTGYVEGTVQQQVPLLESSLYQLLDATGTVWVRSLENPPEIGDRLKVRGVIRQEPILVEGIDISEVYIQEKHRTLLPASESAP